MTLDSCRPIIRRKEIDLLKDIVTLKLGYERLPSEQFFRELAAQTKKRRQAELKLLREAIFPMCAVIITARP